MGVVIELFLIGVGLSMDAFAVAVCKGLKMRKVNYKHTLIIALFFGGFQALMPFVGWLLGNGFSKYVEQYAAWIAFFLLLYIGGRMVYEALTEDEKIDQTEGEKLDIRELLLMAVATSIDALAVGITFAFLGTNIAEAVSIIGITTFMLSLAGVVIGNRFGMKYKNKASVAGGVILILIGLKILLEHFGIL